MSGAAKAAPSGAAAVTGETRGMTPTNAILWHGQELGRAANLLIERIAFLERENGKVHGQLDDALDRVKELERDLAQVRNVARVT